MAHKEAIGALHLFKLDISIAVSENSGLHKADVCVLDRHVFYGYILGVDDGEWSYYVVCEDG